MFKYITKAFDEMVEEDDFGLRRVIFWGKDEEVPIETPKPELRFSLEKTPIEKLMTALGNLGFGFFNCRDYKDNKGHVLRSRAYGLTVMVERYMRFKVISRGEVEVERRKYGLRLVIECMVPWENRQKQDDMANRVSVVSAAVKEHYKPLKGLAEGTSLV